MKLFIIFLFLCFSIVVNAQNRVYEVIFFGDVIGKVELEKRKINENSFSYHFNSETETSVFFMDIKTKAVTDLIYENNLLKVAYVLRIKNNKTHELTYNWDSKKYLVKDNEEDLIIEKKITYCTANFFFSEPKNVSEVFVERFNYFVPIEYLGNNKYLTKVDGGTNLYTYKNGILQSVKSKKGLSVYMRLKA